MIAIFSHSNDFSVHEVCKWLDYYNQPYVIFNDLSIITEINVKIRKYRKYKVEIVLNNEITVDLFAITSIWVRHNEIYFDSGFVQKNNLNYSLLQIANDFALNEIEEIKQFIINILSRDDVFSIGKFGQLRNNKLFNLILANNAGLEIPDSYIISQISGFDKNNDLKYEELITKPIHNSIFTFWEETKEDLSMYTRIVDPKNILKCKTDFPTFFQSKINKYIEVRTFYIFKTFFSIAILSQRNTKSNLDYRNYDREDCNYMLPFKLPKQIEKKIEIFMNSANLQVGSIDLIYSEENKWYFLEVNPTGQYSFVDKIANYNIDKFIAKLLINNGKN